MVSIEVPDKYGYVILTCVVGQWVAGMVCSNYVMKARDKYNVNYPNLYAVPGYHKQADEFNRVQRGHQNMYETLSTFSLFALIGGLKYPLFCSAGSVLYDVGCVLYLIGYSDTILDVKTARYKKGGLLKWVGFFSTMGATISVAGSMIGWW